MTGIDPLKSCGLCANPRLKSSELWVTEALANLNHLRQCVSSQHYNIRFHDSLVKVQHIRHIKHMTCGFVVL